jgi:hypothetical protein
VPEISISARTCGADPPDSTQIKCGRGLAPDSCGPVGIYLAEPPPSGASPLPHWISVCQGRPSRWLMAVLSFIGRICATHFPDSTPAKCGRGLAPDSYEPVGIYLAEPPPSGASPLPHWISVCQGRLSRWLMAVLSFIGPICATHFPDSTPAKGGRGLAPDSCGPVNTFLTETPPSGASPLPHWISVCQGRPSRWLMAVLSFIGRICATHFPDSTPANGGRGLAPDTCGPVNTFLIETPPSGASPLPHWISVCQGRPSRWLWRF